MSTQGRLPWEVGSCLSLETYKQRRGNFSLGSLERSQGSGTDDPNNLCGPFDPEFMGFCCDSPSAAALSVDIQMPRTDAVLRRSVLFLPDDVFLAREAGSVRSFTSIPH